MSLDFGVGCTFSIQVGILSTGLVSTNLICMLVQHVPSKHNQSYVWWHLERILMARKIVHCFPTLRMPSIGVLTQFLVSQRKKCFFLTV